MSKAPAAPTLVPKIFARGKTEVIAINAKRSEYNKPSFRAKCFREHGKVCVNCGSSEGVELHHIVPLSAGGTNNIQNIVPLCYECHKKAHGGTAKEWSAVNKKHRPRKITQVDNWEQIIQDYLECRSGLKETKANLHMTERTKLTDAVWFKEYLKEHDIVSFKNNIDMHTGKRGRGLRPGMIVGKVETTNSTMVYTWHPDGISVAVLT